ncbi:hypothetical protein PSCFBP2116_03160 [Pseudomonas syringae]|nr:hypothetical protein PSCFBP2116_03160 [Pseudomonas syringae]
MLADIDGLQVVGQADSGEESLKKARELKPDVVLMDVKMPGIGGLEATRKMLAATLISRSSQSLSVKKTRFRPVCCRQVLPAT